MLKRQRKAIESSPSPMTRVHEIARLFLEDHRFPLEEEKKFLECVDTALNQIIAPNDVLDVSMEITYEKSTLEVTFGPKYAMRFSSKKALDPSVGEEKYLPTKFQQSFEHESLYTVLIIRFFDKDDLFGHIEEYLSEFYPHEKHHRDFFAKIGEPHDQLSLELFEAKFSDEQKKLMTPEESYFFAGLGYSLLCHVLGCLAQQWNLNTQNTVVWLQAFPWLKKEIKPQPDQKLINSLVSYYESMGFEEIDKDQRIINKRRLKYNFAIMRGTYTELLRQCRNRALKKFQVPCDVKRLDEYEGQMYRWIYAKDINLLHSLVEKNAVTELASYLKESSVKLGNDFSRVINYYNRFRYTPLGVAIKKNFSKVIDLLLSYDVDVDAIQWGGYTPLMLDIKKTKGSSLKKLITYGADVNATDWEGKTALFYAIKNFDQSRVLLLELLLQNHSKVNIVDKRGYTPLMLAIEKEKLQFVQVLVKYKAKIDFSHNEQPGVPPLIYGVSKGTPEIYRFLLTKAKNLEVTDEDKRTPLIISVLKNNLITAKMLLEQGANINAKDSGNVTALMYAVQAQNQEIVVLLLKYDPDLEVISFLQDSALSLAIQTKNIEITQMLLEKGADLNVKTFYGENALAVARRNSNDDIIKLLLRYGAIEPMKD